jgi:glycosyltransferase involved in cell wall biosynthesis
MRVLYFTRDYTPHDHRFLTALAKAGQQVFYLRLEQGGYAVEDRPLPTEVELVHWAGGRRPFRWQDGLSLLVDLKRVIHKVKPDIVHAGPLQTSAFLTAMAGFRPLVSMSWGYDLLQDANRNTLWRWATRFTLRHSSIMVGDCLTIRQKAVAYGMSEERIVTFPWGIDLSHFSPANGHRSKGKTFTLLSTRAWEPVYGVDVIAHAFVRAVHRLAGSHEKEWSSSNLGDFNLERPAVSDPVELCLTMLGNGSQAAELRRIFLQGGVLDKVYFPGQVAQVDLPRYYRSADLYVSASHSDGTSISLLEAMACGCPALVSDIPGNREWVSPGEQGWCFPDGDSEALSASILHALHERHLLLEMGRSSRRLAEQHADWEKNFPELLRAYELAQQSC